jgi:hypothetical protein
LGLGTVLWALIPALSLGLLAPVPFAHAAIRLKQRRLWAVTAAYAVVWLVEVVLAAGPEGGWRDTVLGVATFALMVVGTVHAFLLRGRVFAPPATDPVIAAAFATRQRREQARAIATRDLALARELRIGRPDLPRQFDDGGLVDVNHVPAQVLVQRLGLSVAQADKVVQARERLGGYAGPQELVASGELPEATVNTLRDRMLFLAGDLDASTPPQPQPGHPPPDDHDDPPGTTAPEAGTGPPPPGWYPDPADPRGVRYWDGAGWSDQPAAPTRPPPASDAAPRRLNAVFAAEVPCALLSLWLAILAGGFAAAGCYGTGGSDQSCRAFVWAWGVVVAVHLTALVAGGVLFVVGVIRKRVALKRRAVVVLPSGIAAAWVLFFAVGGLAGS